MPPLIRPARPDELEPLLAMQQRSLRVLGAGFYPCDVLEAALAQMGTMDPRMIGDGTYLVAEVEGEIAGSAGWTMRPPNYARLLPGPLCALPGRCGVVRSVYVAPEMVRQGLARRLMGAVEERLTATGAERAELMATLSGVPLYLALGYRTVSHHALKLAEGLELEVERMARTLLPPRAAAHGAFTAHRGSAGAPCPAAAGGA